MCGYVGDAFEDKSLPHFLDFKDMRDAFDLECNVSPRVWHVR